MISRPGMVESSRRKAHRALRIVLVVALLQALVAIVSPAHSRERSQDTWEFITSRMTAPVTSAHGRKDHASKPEFVGKLGRGDALFWDGPHLENVGTGKRTVDPLLCDSPATTNHGCGVGAWRADTPTFIVQDTAMAGPLLRQDESPLCGSEQACFAYTFDVTEPGDVLRVAFDQPSLRDLIWVYLYNPDGALVGRLFRTRTEAWFEQPVEGLWTARVVVDDARDTSFRMRVALDPDDRRHGPRRGGTRGKPGLLLPNLQVLPPHEIGFGSCHATEIVDYGARRCLRFTTGPQNVGDGPLDLLLTETAALEGQMYQRLHRVDGTTEVVDAGTFEYHPEHAHYHHGAIQSLDLLRVADERRGVLEPAGSGPKIGFCLEPYHIAEWHTFAQDRPYTVYDNERCAGSVRAPVPTQMALARGFVDPYPWYVEGNFVDFGDNHDGLYVIRAASDPDATIRETREDDNFAYTYIRVTGDDIEVLERGLGKSPWDRPKSVVDDTRRPLRWSE